MSRSPTSDVASFGASCGNPSARASTNPRCVTVGVCAPSGVDAASAAAIIQSRQPVLLAADGLQCELVILHRDVVLQLVEREARAAAAPEVRHLEDPRGPDALHGREVQIVQPAHDLILDVVLDTQ